MQKTFTAFFCTISFLLTCTAGRAQTVTLSGRDMPLKQVFAAIKKQTGYVVFYNQQMLTGTKPVTLTVNKVSLTELLQLVFSDQPIQYVIQDKTIALSRKPAAGAYNIHIEISSGPQLLVTGTIRATNNDLLSGAAVRLKNSSRGAITDAFGGFSLNRVPENAVLEISMIGYETVEFTVVLRDGKYQLVPKGEVNYVSNETANPAEILLTLRMKEFQSVLDETQVIAYGKTSRRYTTGSIGTVKAEDIQKQPVMNVLQALEGRVAGLVLTPNTGNSAAPIKVEIRGRNSLNPDALQEPLYVIDGMPVGALNVSALSGGQTLNGGPVQAGITNTFGESALFNLNPRDIESIDVLKDASATAIYGARGANGVILITTKKGKAGPTQFNVSIAKGKTTIPRKLDLMNTEEYLAVRKEAFRNDGITPDLYNAPDLLLWDQSRFVDWQDYFFSPGETLDASAGMSGGMANTSFNLSAGFSSRQELMNKGGKNKRGTFAGSVAHTSTNQKFQANFSAQLSITNVTAIPAGNYIYTPPNAPDVYNEKGDFNFVPYRGLISSNFPFTELNKPSESKSSFVTTNLQLGYELVKGLKISAYAAYGYTGNDNAKFIPNKSFDPFFGGFSQVIFGKSSNTNWLVRPQLAYKTFLGAKGNLSVQLLSELQSVKNEGVTTLAMGFPNDNLLRSPNNASLVSVMEGSGAYKYVSGAAIVNYNWDGKYIIDVNGRRDGSSRFGPGRQFGNFGSVGLAWIASEESWMKSLLPSWFSFVKWRGSYGIAGGDNVGDYEFLTRWGSSRSLGSPNMLLQYNGTPAFGLLAPVNQDFRWESTTKLDLGVNLGFLHDNITVEASYYRNRSGSQLTTMATPSYTGFNDVRVNWEALVENNGVELGLIAKIIKTKNWRVAANVNFSRNRNKLVDYPGLQYSAYADRYVVGQSINFKYLFHYIGIDPASGDYVLEDHNKDGVVSNFQTEVPNHPQDDRYIVYDLNPSYTGGLGFQVDYKGFSVSTQFHYKKRLAQDPYFALQLGGRQNQYVPDEIARNHWKKPGDIALYPKYTTGLLTNIANTDRFYTDGSFIRLGTLSLSYDLPAGWLSKTKIQRCQLNVDTQNLLTITSYRGVDPEVSLPGGTPIPRTTNIRLSFTF